MMRAALSAEENPSPLPTVHRLLRQLEIPDCGCSWPEIPCRCRRNLISLVDRTEHTIVEAFVGSWRHPGKDPAVICRVYRITLDQLRDILIRWAAVVDSVANASEPCDCPVVYAPPCIHVRSNGHDLSLDEWSELLAAVWPEEHSPPPTPAGPALAMTREARIAVMQARYTCGEHIHHPGDLWRNETEHVGRQPLAPTGKARIRNGRNAAAEVFVLDRAA